MEKRGIGHLEVILSFLIFIAAVGFALYFFNPTHTNNLIDSSLSYAIDEIKSNISSDIKIYSVKINNENNMINNANNFVAINLSRARGNVRVVNSAGQVLPSKTELVDGNDLIVYFNNSALVWPESSLVRIYVNNDYPSYSPVPSVSAEINPDFYQLASVNDKKIFLESAILALNRSYWQDYSSIKKKFNINSAEFGFSIKFLNGDLIDSTKPIPKGFDVFSNKEKIEVLRNNSQIESADLAVQIW